MEKWIAETGNTKNGTSTIFLKGSFLGIWAKMRKCEGVSSIYKLAVSEEIMKKTDSILLKYFRPKKIEYYQDRTIYELIGIKNIKSICQLQEI